MKNLILLSASALLVSCSSQRALSIKSVKITDGVGQKIGNKEFEDCNWAISLGIVGPYDKFSVEQILRDNDPKIFAVNDLKITHTGYGIYGVGRYCMKIQGDYYAIQ